MTMWTAILGIVVVGCLTTVLKNYFQSREGAGEQARQEIVTLGQRVDELTDRVKTLERIVTDKPHGLKQEIEDL